MPKGLINTIARDPYMLSVVSPAVGESNFVIALPFVTRVEYLRNAATIPQWTLGGRDVYFHSSGIKTERIVIIGRSGYSPRLGTDKNGAPFFATGPELFQEVEEFIYNYEATRGYQADITKTFKTLQHPIRMTFRALNENKNLYVEPVSFSFNRDARSSRFGYIYRLELIAYKKVDFKLKTNWIDDVAKALKAATSAVNKANAAIAQLRQDLSEVRGAFNALLGPINAARRVLTTAATLVREAYGFINFIPASVVDQILGAANDFLDVVDAVAADVPFGATRGTGLSTELHNAQQAIHDARRIAFDAMFFRRDPPPSAASDNTTGGDASQGNVASAVEESGGGAIATAELPLTSGQDGEKVQSVFKIKVLGGESLKDFAQRVTGDYRNWTKIAILNGMSNALYFSTGQPLVAGTELLTPMDSAVSGGVNSDGTGQYGVDLLLGPQGDLRLSGTKDFALVRGTENLKQGITNRLLTFAGEVRSAPAMGMPPVIGTRQISKNIAQAIFAAESQILSDGRVKEIQDFKFVEGAGVIEFNITVEPYGGSVFDVITDIEVAS